MVKSPHRRSAYRVAVLGSPCAFTAAALTGLLGEDLTPALVILRAAPDGPARTPRSFASIPADPVRRLAQTHPLTVHAVRELNAPAVRGLVREHAIDVLLVACLGQRIGAPLRRSARRAALNLHPSLLPAYRGPAPLFWQVRAAECRLGVSVHAMTDAMDAGPVLAQATLEPTSGTVLEALEREIAALGGRLAARVLDNDPIAAGTPQDEARASRQPRPGPDDLALDPGWSAARAFLFMRTVGAPVPGHRLRVDGHQLRLTRALAFDARRSLPTAFLADGETLEVRLNPGVLRARGTVE
jgi:methionyl-tRNA formyltransferase